MKRTSITVTLLALSAAIMTTLPAGAQLKYKEHESICIGEHFPDPNYGVTARGFQLFQIYGPGSMFYANTNHTMCYIRGSSWNVLFYNRQTNKYNDVRAAYVLTYANGEIYDTWIDPAYTSSVLRTLRPVEFNTSGSQKTSMATAEKTKSGYGFVASEVEELLPKAVITDEDGNKLINYSAFIPLATRSISDIYHKIQENGKKLKQLESMSE